MMRMNDTSEFEDVCESPEAGLASEIYRYFGLTFICLSSFAIVSGGVLWYVYRKNAYLSRRNPILVSMLTIPLLCQVVSASFYRLYLNDVTAFGNCGFTNFFFCLVSPTVMIPLCARMMSFHHRTVLNKKLTGLNERSQSNNYIGEEADSSTAPIEISRAVTFRLNTASEQSQYEDYAIYKEVNRLKTRARSWYSIKLALWLQLFAFLGSTVYALFTCPFPTLGLTNCEYGFIATPAIAFVLVPLVLPIGIYIYFGQLVKKLPDPFHIRREMRILIIFMLLGLGFIALSAFDVGSFASLEGDELLYFKWELLLEYCLLLGYINTIHVQIFYAIRSKAEIGTVPLSMDEMLEHAEGVKVFEIFLQNEFSVENLKVYQLLVGWRETTENQGWGLKRNGHEARKLFQIWLNPDNEDGIGVNVSYTSLAPLIDQMKSNESSFPSTVFDDVIRELYNLMRNDSFRRFVKTNEYREFVGVQEPELLKDEYWDEIDFKRCCGCFPC